MQNKVKRFAIRAMIPCILLLASCTRTYESASLKVTTNSKEGVYDVIIHTTDGIIARCGHMREGHSGNFLSLPPEQVSKVIKATYYRDRTAETMVTANSPNTIDIKDKEELHVHLDVSENTLLLKKNN